MLQIGDIYTLKNLCNWYYRHDLADIDYQMTRASIEIQLNLVNKVIHKIKLQRIYNLGGATKQAKQIESKIRQHKGETDNKLVRAIMKSRIRNAKTEITEVKQRLKESKRDLANCIGNRDANYILKETKYIGNREWQAKKEKMTKQIELIKITTK